MAADRWPRDGVPINPRAWLMTTARNRAAHRIAANGSSQPSSACSWWAIVLLSGSPVMTGVAFLPMVATLVIAGGVCTTQLYPRFGAKIPVTAGMLIAAGAMAWLTRIGPHSTYAADILGPLLVFGLGIGATIAPGDERRNHRRRPPRRGRRLSHREHRPAGGSIGTALLNSLAASALARYLIGKDTTSPTVQTDAAIHGYTVAFWAISAIFAAGAVICGLILRFGKPEPMDPDAAPTIHA
jgi:hypothetical protein